MSPTTSLTLTAQQKRLVRQTFDSISDYPEAVVFLFYGRLFELAPEVRNLFHIDMREQTRKLADMIATIVGALDRFEELRPELMELGRRHAGYGAKPEHYDMLRQALLWALGQALSGEFDRNTKAAWNTLLETVAATMLEGTAQPPTDASA